MPKGIPTIQPQKKVKSETIGVRLDEEMLVHLDDYCAFIDSTASAKGQHESDRSYVIRQALEFFFQNEEFVAFQRAKYDKVMPSTASSTIREFIQADYDKSVASKVAGS